MREFLLITSGIIGSVSFIPYILLIWRHAVRPVRITWAVWALILWVSTLAQGSLGAEETLVFAWIDTLGVTAVFLLSLQYGKRGYTRLDMVCLIVALVSIVGWIALGDARVGIYLNIIADVCAAIPLIIHAYHKPDEEDSTTFLLFACGGLMNLTTVSNWDIDIVAFPVYVICLNITVALLIRLRQIAKMPYRKKSRALAEDYDVVPL